MILKIKSSSLLLGLFLGSFTLQAQDETIFRAMQDEMNRTENELFLPGFEKPFFVSYALNRAYSFQMTATLGALVSSLETPCSSVASIRLLQGNYQINNEFRYGGQFTDIRMPREADYNLIRRNLWLGTDLAYKQSLQEYANKVAYRKENPASPGEHFPDDLLQIKPVVQILEPRAAYRFNRSEWENKLRELSAVFLNYGDFFNSSVVMGGIDMDIYNQTSEGTKTKQPFSYVSLSAQASVRTDEGVLFGDVWSVIARIPEELPPLDELKKQIAEFAENLIRLREATPITEYYSGPVLFEDKACQQIFTENLLNHNALFAQRQVDGKSNSKALEKRINKKVIDSRLTVKNYSTLSKYKNVSLLGAYEIDAEGVTPEKEMTLIENGYLRGLLNGRFPTRQTPRSTGSSRYTLTVGRISFTTAPGTIHISVKEGSKPEQMKKALIRAAREEGLEYAYIVRKFGGQATLIYQVNVKDGSEIMVRSGDFSPLNLPKLKRLAAISSKEEIANYVLNQQVLSSLIYPSAILIDDVEINPSELKKNKEPVLEFPLKRQSETQVLTD